MGYLLSLQALERDHPEERGEQFVSSLSVSACRSSISAIC